MLGFVIVSYWKFIDQEKSHIFAANAYREKNEANLFMVSCSSKFFHSSRKEA